ncbi:MAG: PHP domain-containing protein [Firmicutes bacterium]|nr:PHP domain-containing protein [Bacillota bacterium]
MIDLHVHTRFSDGTWTPEEGVAAARRAGVSALAFTDHDAVEAVGPGMAAAVREGLGFISGVEISAGSSADPVHLLGYGIDPDHPALREVLAKNQAAWEENERLSLERRARLGVVISPERYEYWRRHREAGGWPTLNCLVEMGLVTDYREYFDRYFGPGRPAYVETTFVAPAEAIAAIKAAGGVPVLAHPGAYHPEGKTILERQELLAEMVALGIEGLEVYSQANSPAVQEFLSAYAREHDLLVTGGSDCHGEFIPARRLGFPPVPDECFTALLARMNPERVVLSPSVRR